MPPFSDRHTTHLQMDATPTSGSDNLVTSGALHTALGQKESLLTFANDVLNTVVGGSISRDSNTVVYTPPNLTSYAPKDSPTFTGAFQTESVKASSVVKCNEFQFATLPNVTNNTAIPCIKFVVFSGVGGWWCTNSANEGGLFRTSTNGFDTAFPSDDRLKFNETPIVDGIELVKQMNPMRYDQIDSLDDDVSQSKEQIGFIADEIEAIDGLGSLVMDKPDSHYPENGKTVKSLQYNGIFTISVQALKELIDVVEAQAVTINRLNERVTFLESN